MMYILYDVYILYDSNPQEDPKYWITFFLKVLPAPIFFGGLLNGRLPPLVDDPSGFFKKKRDGKSSYGKWCLG